MGACSTHTDAASPLDGRRERRRGNLPGVRFAVSNSLVAVATDPLPAHRSSQFGREAAAFRAFSDGQDDLRQMACYSYSRPRCAWPATRIVPSGLLAKRRYHRTTSGGRVMSRE